MNDEPQTGDNRRGQYSFRGHLARLARSGRLKYVALVTVAVVAIGGITFGRCSSSNITGPSPVATKSQPSADLLGGGSGSATQPSNTSFTYPWSKAVINQCNGDEVMISGNTHVELYTHPTPDGGFHSHNHETDRFQGVSSDGTKYTGSDEHLEASRIDFTRGSVYKSQYVYDKLIANGPQPDFYVRVKTVVKYDATNPLGSPPVPVVEMDTDCRGQCGPGESCVDPCPASGCAAIIE